MESTHLCYNANKCDKDANKRCTRCKCAWYCSVECQQIHYSIHRPYCLATAAKIDANNPKQVNRGVMLPDKTYEEAMKTTGSGKPFIIVGRDDEKTEVIRRRDGKLYEIPSGLPIVSMSVIKQHESVKTDYMTNWGKMMHHCGGAIMDKHGFAVFHLKEKQCVYILDKKKDVIIGKQENIVEIVDCKLELDNSGKPIWEIFGMGTKQ